MFTFLTILAIIICLFLILFILIQNPKGGGLSSNFGASNQIMGVQKTGDFLEKTTWGLAVGLLVICLSMKVFTPGTTRDNEPLEIQKQLEKTPVGNSNTNPVGSPGSGGSLGLPTKTSRPTSSSAAVPASSGKGGNTNSPSVAPTPASNTTKK